MSIITIDAGNASTRVSVYRKISKMINTFFRSGSESEVKLLESNLIANFNIYALNALKDDFNFSDDDLIKFVEKFKQNVNSESINNYFEVSAKLSNLPVTLTDVEYNIENGCEY